MTTPTPEPYDGEEAQEAAPEAVLNDAERGQLVPLMTQFCLLGCASPSRQWFKLEMTT